MTRKIDHQVLLGFVEEARGYLPRICRGAETALEDPTRLDALEEIHRLFHSIKGAASMVGLAPLSHMAYYGEEAVERIGAGQLPLDRPTTDVLRQTTELIARYLDELVADRLQARPLLAQTVVLYRRLRGLPESGDETELVQLMPDEEPSAAPPEPSFPAPPPEPSFLAPREPSFPAPPREEEEVSPELMEAFLQEAEDHLQSVSRLLRELEKEPDDKDNIQQVRRSVHTLKGAAAMVGFAALSQLAHRMEDMLDLVYEGAMELGPQHMDLLLATSDAMADLASDNVDMAAFEPVLGEVHDRYATILGQLPSSEAGLAPSPPALEPLDGESMLDLSDLAAQAEPERREGERRQDDRREASTSQIVRVPIERLDELVRLVSELVVQRSTFEQHHQRLSREVEELRLSMSRLGRLSNRFETEYEVLALSSSRAALEPATVGVGTATPLAPAGFDDLELDRYTDFHLLSRELSETDSDIGAVVGELGNSVGDFDGYLTRVGRLTSEVQDKLMRLRMVPLANLASRLHRAVRVTARKQGKQVDLTIDGGEIELDKTVLEQIADPLLHLLRNAVDHGIEPPELRQALGKEQRGSIRVHAYHEGTFVVIVVSDDGAGLDHDRLRQAAVEGGYVSDANAAALTEAQLRSLVFQPGFSTANEVSEISGRGVGLDVVKENMQRIKGVVSVDSKPGQGVTFTVRLPMTLAITRVLLVEAYGQTFAVPLASVSQILRIEASEMESLGKESVVRLEGRALPALHLGEALGLEAAVEGTVMGGTVAGRLPILVLSFGDQRLALIVDRIVEAREVVVKTLGNLLQRVEDLTGATLMGDGRVVLILNPSDLMKQTTPEGAERLRQPRLGGPEEPEIHLPTERHTLDVMIVDDSVSVRRVLSNLISNSGWNPITAKDGLEALEILQSRPQSPDVILLDIEMPRMDGYELTATLRAHESFITIPIVMLTSRAGEKHRRRAFELGATEYLVKPYHDETLLNVIRRVVRERRGASG